MKYYDREMDTIHPDNCVALTWEDAEYAEELNRACGWGFSAPDMLRFIADYMDAFCDSEEETDADNSMKDYLVMERIEWRLEDANFHTLCEFFHAHKFTDAVVWVTNTMM